MFGDTRHASSMTVTAISSQPSLAIVFRQYFSLAVLVEGFLGGIEVILEQSARIWQAASPGSRMDFVQRSVPNFKDRVQQDLTALRNAPPEELATLIPERDRGWLQAKATVSRHSLADELLPRYAYWFTNYSEAHRHGYEELFAEEFALASRPGSPNPADAISRRYFQNSMSYVSQALQKEE